MRKQVRGNAKVLAVATRKGGQHKTTISRIVAHGLALQGYAVCALEFDDNPRWFELETGLRRRSTVKLDNLRTTHALFGDTAFDPTQVMFEVDTADALARVPSLSKDRVAQIACDRGWRQPAPFLFLPGSEALQNKDIEFGSRMMQERGFQPSTQLVKAFAYLRPQFDFIICDTPPSLTFVQQNVLAVADGVAIVMGFSTASINDYDRTKDAVRRARQICLDLRLPLPELLGVIYSGYNAQERDVRALHDLLYTAYTQTHENPDVKGEREPAWVSDPQLGFLPADEKNVPLAEAAHKHTVLTYVPTCDYARAGYELVETVKQALLAL
jgi:cellulose biosynthesis protein BcsQ